MTKQNTHSEQSDVETSVVEHLPASETDASLPSPSETVEPIGEIVEAAVVSTSADPEVPPGEQVTQQIPREEEQEVRPFTDFIEEFRQAEERFNSSLQAYQTDSAPNIEEAPMANEHSPSGQDTVDDAGTRFSAPAEPSLLEQAGEEEVRAASKSSGAESDPATAAERPVSPLLRPASRLRQPRHGGGRHREEQSVEKKAPSEAETLKGALEAKTEPAPVVEEPKPARRYRFDRPASSATNTPAVPSLAANSQAQSRSEDNKEVANRGATGAPSVFTRPENGHVINGQTGEKEAQLREEASGAQLTQAVIQETLTEETNANATPATSSLQEHDRRRRDRQRGKEQSAPVPPTLPTPVAEVAPTSLESTSSQKEEVNPEDLPPLEYSELQKASSRRRRRRHPGGSVPTGPTPIATKAITPGIPPVSPAQALLSVPQTPSTAAVPANQYTITSGYTVNQMNQGHDQGTPFMGPEPSPARGSMAAQHVRSIRSDVQRAPAYPVRTTEATSASVHQLASIVSQALQTQTDRLVSELRLANQAPTNISVSMPPFPSNERVGVFVDVANLLYSARTQRMTIDFGKLLDFLRGNRRLIRAHAYCPTSPQPGDEQMFLQAVKGLGYRITTKNYKTFSSGAKKADLDLDLCMDVVRLVDGKSVDCIVLVSGDSDFMPMLDYCSDHGVRVEVAAFDEAMSATLRQSCDLFINLSMLEEIRV